MAVADVPGLMDIASTLAQDEIPFKLRCAICNRLAVNAFRLPCCDQSICETCQASLSDTCPVCTHTPVSPDLCKPNKALRTTLKAFLRTEEKKREKDRQSAAPPTPSIITPADTKVPLQDAIPDQNPAELVTSVETDAPVPPGPTEPTESKPQEPGLDTPAPDTVGESIPEPSAPDSADQPAQPEATGDQLNGTEAALGSTTEDAAVNETQLNGEPAPTPEEVPGECGTNPMAPNMAGNFPAMGWNGNGMNPFMTGMFNYPNTMGMPMGMDPMANQGMYGMNMTGMGMNNGMNYNGGMYGSLGWDASQQNNNMWQGGQNKFNPNAFANGTGPPYGGPFGGSNMSAYPSHSDYQSGYYGGYGRGGYRGRGRGQFHGSGRGGFGPMQGHYRQGANGYPNQNPSMPNGLNGTPVDAQGNVQTNETQESGENGPDVPGNPDDIPTGTDQPNQPQGIPTIDSLDNSVPTGPGYGSNGYGQYRYGRYGQERGPGVEGAPAAPRAMRQGLPNTSVLRQRGFQIQGRASISGEPPEDDHTRDTSNALSQRAQSRSQSPSHPASRPRSPSVHGTEDDHDSRRGAEIKRPDRVDELQSDARHSRSPSRTSSRPSSRRRHQDSERERGRRTSHRSQRSRRHRSRSRSSSRNGDARPSSRLEKITEKDGSNGRTKASFEAPESRDLASRISSTYRSTKDRGSRREDDRSREQDRDLRRRDRDRDRDRDRRGRDRDPDRERRRDGDRDKDRTSERDRDRPRERDRDRDRDRKRSRRDRSPSATGGDHPQARRVKRGDEDRSRDTNGASTKRAEPDKDPYTLEREARNKERLEREQQHREKAKSGRRRDSRQDRVVAGRRINYKYEDEL
ncbi:hypothetical protein N7517_002012 [Penicillium concentricum]|uniref:RING-type domain-containing protein n=1 Tax=Penicillium concentricum TaxID=293559 RepID=A0A9W9VLA5_9EURO|nr:uncharacterized protein N7517_002012 [Penicillium concentricum]KAJ5384101.1 hypothetical protein N7517_002012 [Penicillium concentricum]